MIILRITIREIARAAYLVRNIRRYGLRRAWRIYVFVHKFYARGVCVQIEEEA